MRVSIGLDHTRKLRPRLRSVTLRVPQALTANQTPLSLILVARARMRAEVSPMQEGRRVRVDELPNATELQVERCAMDARANAQ
jgi:hypothetical protein